MEKLWLEARKVRPASAEGGLANLTRGTRAWNPVGHTLANSDSSRRAGRGSNSFVCDCCDSQRCRVPLLRLLTVSRVIPETSNGVVGDRKASFLPLMKPSERKNHKFIAPKRHLELSYGVKNSFLIT